MVRNTFYLILLTFFILSCEDSFRNSAPEIDDQLFTIEENLENGSLVGTIVASDPDKTQSISFSIASGNTLDAFAIDESTGDITVNNTEALDFETTPQFILEITVVDDFATPGIAAASVTIDLTDIEITETITLKPGPAEGKDAQAWSFDPNGNLDRGTDRRDIVVYEWTYQGNVVKKYGLIDFDLSFIKVDDTINEATLNLYHDSGSFDTGHSTLSGTNEFYIERIITPWIESLGWAGLPETTEVNRVLVPESISDTQDYQIVMTDLVSDYKDNPGTSQGFLMKMVVDTPFRAVVFGASDHPDESKRPELIINYTHE